MPGILTQIAQVREADRAKLGLPTGPYVHQEYPKLVRVDDGTKVLFANEADHRAARPGDFEPADGEGKKAKKAEK